MRCPVYVATAVGSSGSYAASAVAVPIPTALGAAFGGLLCWQDEYEHSVWASIPLLAAIVAERLTHALEAGRDRRLADDPAIPDLGHEPPGDTSLPCCVMPGLMRQER